MPPKSEGKALLQERFYAGAPSLDMTEEEIDLPVALFEEALQKALNK